VADPTFLIVRSKVPALRFDQFCRANAGCGGRLAAACPIHEVAALEPGSQPQHTWIAKFPSMIAARDAWSSRIDASMLAQPEPPLVLAARAVPEEGYPPELDFIPTHRNVDPAPSPSPTLLLIEGSASDAQRMERYRDIILPMMKERRSYYTVFELGGNVEVLSGTWGEAIFAVSRWPKREAALDFWLCREYQETAIPLRLDIGRFSVLALAEAIDGA